MYKRKLGSRGLAEPALASRLVAAVGEQDGDERRDRPFIDELKGVLKFAAVQRSLKIPDGPERVPAFSHEREVPPDP
ncbi:MAG: hypothetical protein IPG04_16900 [Polyangiaceae bacterium]|nr:hypothetical protein [Polyangiaceae bacterium]